MHGRAIEVAGFPGSGAWMKAAQSEMHGPFPVLDSCTSRVAKDARTKSIQFVCFWAPFPIVKIVAAAVVDLDHWFVNMAETDLGRRIFFGMGLAQVCAVP